MLIEKGAASLGIYVMLLRTHKLNTATHNKVIGLGITRVYVHINQETA